MFEVIIPRKLRNRENFVGNKATLAVIADRALFEKRRTDGAGPAADSEQCRKPRQLLSLGRDNELLIDDSKSPRRLPGSRRGRRMC
jgi:hypothetical protein